MRKGGVRGLAPPSRSRRDGRGGAAYGTRGAPDADHLHGFLIGRDEDGSQRLPIEPYVSADKETKAEKNEAHAHTCFNKRRSASLPLDRNLGDHRNDGCAAIDYGALPRASVVVVFFDEPLSTLLRSVASVFHRTPPELLHEVILVEDGGTGLYGSTGDSLKAQLEVFGEKIVLLEMPEQTGLIRARTTGAAAATGDVLVFLDSHIECTAGWLEPLLGYVRDTPLGYAIPFIDSIDADTFLYKASGIRLLGFSWSLGQEHLGGRKIDPVKPTETPIMAGGLFAVAKATFDALGTYDTEMRIYGGEEMEISLRAWMSGGRLDLVPCSRVGHVFRSKGFWEGQVYPVPGDEIHRNKLRAALVWMDDYAIIVEKLFPAQPETNPIGDLSDRIAFRKRVGKHDFSWYLDTVYPELKRPPTDYSVFGSLRSSKGCLDTYAANPVHGPGIYPCHDQPGHGSQLFMLAMDGRLIFGNTLGKALRCVVVKTGEITLSEAACGDPAPGSPEWTLTPAGTLQHASGLCLLAITSQISSLGDCEAELDVRTWYKASTPSLTYALKT